MARIMKKAQATSATTRHAKRESKTDSNKMNDRKLQHTVTQPMTLAQKRTLLKALQNDPDGTISALRRPEILMDFFTDCLSPSITSEGNEENDLSLAVPALSGIFHLITTRNLDYPAFYARLYGLIDSRLLHSKHRSRLLRHLDTFLSPTNHLPATTVASFIKKLSRRCLFAPPAAIVAVVPLIYNLLKTYPQTTFMIHRKPLPPQTTTESAIEEGKGSTNKDPWNPNEPDPQFTDAISSSLWELDTLRTHYHPTVSGICRIIAEQFTKQSYHLDDFLDHGYASLMDGELRKKKRSKEAESEGADETKTGRRGPRTRAPPSSSVVVEYKIPKHIFTAPSSTTTTTTTMTSVDDEGHRPSLLTELWTF